MTKEKSRGKKMLWILFSACKSATYIHSDSDLDIKIEISEKLELEASSFMISNNASGKKVLGMMLEVSLGRTGGTYDNSYPQLKILKYYKNGGIASETCSFFVYPYDDEKTFLKVKEWNKDNPDNPLGINNNAYIGSCDLGSWSANYIQKVYIYN